MEREVVESFARKWVDAWSRRDIEAVLSQFAETARFTSPRATARIGRATVEGKAALRAYWQTALAHAASIRFTLDHATWDEARRELLIVYTNEVDGERTRACELLRFDAGGLVVEGEAWYGAGADAPPATRAVRPTEEPVNERTEPDAGHRRRDALAAARAAYLRLTGIPDEADPLPLDVDEDWETFFGEADEHEILTRLDQSTERVASALEPEEE